MKIVLLTSDNLRHKAIANMIAEQLVVTLVVTEKKSPAISNTESLDKEDEAFIRKHFLKRKESEEKYFGEYLEFPSKSLLMKVDHGQINSQKVNKAIENARPDYIILFGTSIIKEALLNKFPGRIINLHLGLSPYYRGSATNFFPYYYEEPECVGGTIHLTTSEVDKGEILYQFRPDISLGDDLHDIGNKVILKGGIFLPEILIKYDRGEIKPIPQTGKGYLCRTKDLKPDLIRAIYKKIENGLIDSYLADQATRDARKPIKDQAY